MVRPPRLTRLLVADSGAGASSPAAFTKPREPARFSPEVCKSRENSAGCIPTRGRIERMGLGLDSDLPRPATRRTPLLVRSLMDGGDHGLMYLGTAGSAQFLTPAGPGTTYLNFEIRPPRSLHVYLLYDWISFVGFFNDFDWAFCQGPSFQCVS